MNDIPNIHDKYFKEFLDNPQVAEKLLEEILPEKLKKLIDLSFIMPEKGNFINQELREAYSDLLFKSRLKSGHEIYIYFLVEHKSYMYELTSSQLLKYMVNIWEREINKEKKKKLTPIIPVVFYHGEEEWRMPTEFISLIEGIKENPDLVEYLPNFRHVLFELGEKEEIEKVGEKVIRVFFRSLFLRKLEGERELNIFTREMLKEIKELGGEYSYLFISVMLYIINTKEDLDREEFFNYVEEILPERREDVMTIAEQLRREGEIRGIEKGIEKTAIKALQEGFDIETVARITGLSLEKLEELKKQLN